MEASLGEAAGVFQASLTEMKGENSLLPSKRKRKRQAGNQTGGMGAPLNINGINMA